MEAGVETQVRGKRAAWGWLRTGEIHKQARETGAAPTR